MVSTVQAETRFAGVPGDATKPGIVNQQAKVTYAPEQIARALEESDWFKSLPADKQARLKLILKHRGFSNNGMSMAFPYMAPDNNNALFADLFAKHFIVNENADASKNLFGPWAPPAGTR